jgi:hypothetical protein
MKQRLTEAELWRRELEKIDRRIQNPRTTPKQKEELWRQRNKLFTKAIPGAINLNDTP